MVAELGMASFESMVLKRLCPMKNLILITRTSWIIHSKTLDALAMGHVGDLLRLGTARQRQVLYAFRV